MSEQFPEAEIRMIHGRGGVFDVTYQGELIFSKFNLGRFPDSREIINSVEERMQ